MDSSGRPPSWLSPTDDVLVHMVRINAIPTVLPSRSIPLPGYETCKNAHTIQIQVNMVHVALIKAFVQLLI